MKIHVINIDGNKSDDIDISDMSIESPPQSVVDALSDDLNTSMALAEINQIATSLTKANNSRDKKILKASLLSSGNLFGIFQNNPDSWLGYNSLESDIDSVKIEELLEERNQARKNKNFNRADEIRSKIYDMGIEIEDTPGGSIWRKK